MHALYKIKDLTVGYNGEIPVLKIDELDIPRGKVIFMLGASGVGKSTLLETLGLMNNTFLKGQEGTLEFYPRDRPESCDIEKLWSSQEIDRSDVRSSFMSFIFQRSFLLPNLTAGENMMLKSLYLGVEKAQIKDEILKMMKRLDLEAGIFDRPIYMLSGGQQQRVAFIQAFVSSYEVLFADEPTGNLDNATAHNVMKVLIDHIHSSKKTCIVVSHDVHLANRFADCIFFLGLKKMTEDKNIGYLSKDLTFYKNEEMWVNKNGSPVDINQIAMNIYQDVAV